MILENLVEIEASLKTVETTDVSPAQLATLPPPVLGNFYVHCFCEGELMFFVCLFCFAVNFYLFLVFLFFFR